LFDALTLLNREAAALEAQDESDCRASRCGGGQWAFRGGMLLEYGPERHFEAGAGTKAI
jgi:hypothetical protein